MHARQLLIGVMVFAVGAEHHRAPADRPGATAATTAQRRKPRDLHGPRKSPPPAASR
jgi:hypothetical protein